jgi:hypothetical protein
MKPMKRMTIIFIMTWIIGNKISYGIDPTQNYRKDTGFRLGISLNDTRETLFSNITHSGPGFLAGFIIESTKGLIIKRFDLGLNANFLKSSFETETGSGNFHISVNYRYLFRLNNNESKKGFYLGPLAGTDILISYYENWDENHYYWLTAYRLGADMRFEFNTVSDNVLQFECNMPLMSLVSRPPERFLSTQAESKVSDILETIHKDIKVLLPLSHLSCHLKAGYSFRNLKKFKPALFWQFYYLRNNKSDSRQLTIINQTFGAEFYF